MMDETSDDAQTDDATGAEVQDAAADDAEQALALLDRLRVEHRRIDQEIDALSETGVADMLKLRRMKKIKLSLKDQIRYLENQTTPDIIA